MDVGQSIHWADAMNGAIDVISVSETPTTRARVWRGQARGGGGSGAKVGPGRMRVGGLSSTAVLRASVDATLLAASTVLTSHAVIDAHWPGTEGRPQGWCCCVSPHLSWLVGLSSPGVVETGRTPAAVAFVPRMLCIAPTTWWVTPRDVEHNEPLSGRIS